ncbi:conserved hypothetical protein, partial [Ricinus communis]
YPNRICSTRSFGASCPSCKSTKFYLPTHIGLCFSTHAGLCSLTPTRVLSAAHFIELPGSIHDEPSSPKQLQPPYAKSTRSYPISYPFRIS